MAAHLRLFPAPEEFNETEHLEDQDSTMFSTSTVHIRLGDLLPLLSVAQSKRLSWIQPFMDEEVGISDDLHDMLMAFRSFRPSAS